MSLTIDAFIISWPGKHENAKQIAQALEGEVDRLTVLYSQRDPAAREGDESWHQFPDDWYFGRQFRAMIERFDGDFLLHVMADAQCHDWAKLVRCLRDALADLPSIGVWAPDIDYTYHTLDRVSLGMLRRAGVHAVVHTDETVWALSCDLVTQMRSWDYECNNLGWGIDVAAAFRCHATHRLVVVDTNVAVAHPKTTAYNAQEAVQQSLAFFDNMRLRDRLYFLLTRGPLARRPRVRRCLYWLSRPRRLRVLLASEGRQ